MRNGGGGGCCKLIVTKSPILFKFDKVLNLFSENIDLILIEDICIK